MDEFDTDIFTFRQGSSSIVDDVVIKKGFRDDALLDGLTDEEIYKVYPYILGYQHLPYD